MPDDLDDDDEDLDDEEVGRIKRRVRAVADRAQTQEFLETYPLYRKLPAVVTVYHDKLELYCPQCKRSLPFRPNYSTGTGATEAPVPARARAAIRLPRHLANYGPYACAGCSQSFVVWVEIDETEGWSRKIGQRPSPTDLMPLSRELEDVLNRNDTDLLRKAQIAIGTGFGIGACAYLRRVLENETNTLLALLRETLVEEEGETSPRVVEIEVVLQKKQFDTKAKLASTAEAVPRSLYVAGLNPFKTLHDSFSEALHVTDEDTVLDIAADLAKALEYVVCELGRRRQARAAFATALKRGIAAKPRASNKRLPREQ